MPLDLAGLSLQAGLYPGTLVLSSMEEAVIELCFEHSGGNKTLLLLMEIARRLLSHMHSAQCSGKKTWPPTCRRKMFYSCLEVTARVMTENKYIPYWMLITDRLESAALPCIRKTMINNAGFILLQLMGFKRIPGGGWDSWGKSLIAAQYVIPVRVVNITLEWLWSSLHCLIRNLKQAG